jgi:hypothetical protein
MLPAQAKNLMPMKCSCPTVLLFLMTVVVTPLLFMGGPAEALQLSPIDFSSLGTLSATSDIVINSDTLQLSGGASFTGVVDSTSHAAVFTFDNIQAGNISILGSMPLALLSKGDATYNGLVISSHELEVAAGGTITVNAGGTIGVNNAEPSAGASLTVIANTIQLNSGGQVGGGQVGGGLIVSGGNVTIAAAGGLTPVLNGQTGGGVITLGSSGVIFGNLTSPPAGSGSVQILSGNISLPGSTIQTTGITFLSDPGLTISAAAPVPLPAAAILFGTGMVGLWSLTQRSESQSRA